MLEIAGVNQDWYQRNIEPIVRPTPVYLVFDVSDGSVAFNFDISISNPINIENKTFKASELNIVRESCPITQNEFDDDTIVVKLDCNHIFEKEAIEEWLKQKSTCPCCRMEVK